jgi:hypothetical protein
MMVVRSIAFAVLFSLVAPAFADDAPAALPQKMEGKWGKDGSKKVEVALVKMESPTTAKLDVIFWDGCTRRGETTAELKDGVWTFVAPGVRCEDIKAAISQVPGKNRFEGTYETVWRGSVVKNNIYLEW